MNCGFKNEGKVKITFESGNVNFGGVDMNQYKSYTFSASSGSFYVVKATAGSKTVTRNVVDGD